MSQCINSRRDLSSFFMQVFILQHSTPFSYVVLSPLSAPSVVNLAISHSLLKYLSPVSKLWRVYLTLMLFYWVHGAAAAPSSTCDRGAHHSCLQPSFSLPALLHDQSWFHSIPFENHNGISCDLTSLIKKKRSNRKCSHFYSYVSFHRQILIL